MHRTISPFVPNEACGVLSRRQTEVKRSFIPGGTADRSSTRPSSLARRCIVKTNAVHVPEMQFWAFTLKPQIYCATPVPSPGNGRFCNIYFNWKGLRWSIGKEERTLVHQTVTKCVRSPDHYDWTVTRDSIIWQKGLEQQQMESFGDPSHERNSFRDMQKTCALMSIWEKQNYNII